MALSLYGARCFLLLVSLSLYGARCFLLLVSLSLYGARCFLLVLFYCFTCSLCVRGLCRFPWLRCVWCFERVVVGGEGGS